MGSRIISKNARSLNGFEIANTIPTDGQVLAYQQSSSKYIPSDSSGGGNISNSDLTFDGSYYVDLNSNEWSIKNGSASYFNIKSTGEFVLGKLAQNLSTSSYKERNVVIGYNAQTTALDIYHAVAIGYNASCQRRGAVAIAGISSGIEAISIIGSATNTQCIAIGHNAQASGNSRAIAIGKDTVASNNGTIALGSTSTIATGQKSIAIGVTSQSTGNASISIGDDARALVTQGIAIGSHTEVVSGHTNSIVLGNGVQNTAGNRLLSTATNQFVVGFGSTSPTILIGATTDSYIKSTGNLSLETNTTIKGSDNAAATSGFKVTDVNNLSLLDIKNDGVVTITRPAAATTNSALMIDSSASGVGAGGIQINQGASNYGLSVFGDNNSIIHTFKNASGTNGMTIGSDSIEGYLLGVYNNGASIGGGMFFNASFQSSGGSFGGIGLGYGTNLGVISGLDKDIVFRMTSSNLHSFKSTGEVVIGATSVNASAKLQVDSTTQGFAGPRMTTTQRNAISSPLASLEVYDTTLNKKFIWNGTAWEQIKGNIESVSVASATTITTNIDNSELEIVSALASALTLSLIHI